METFLGESYERLTAEEKTALAQYSWPGNVRELKNAADCYLLLGELPKGIGAAVLPQREVIGTEPKPTGIRELVLDIISRHTDADSGIGRTAILWELSKRGIRLSDDKARKLLHTLESEGLIEIGKGRRGCRVI